VKLGILGGTFDPVHIGHLILAESAREGLGLDKVLFVPAGDPWRKASREVTPAKHRLRMVELAIAANEAFSVDAIEIERKGPSYTVETLQELRARFPEAEMYFLLGEDALADLPHWRDPAGIARLARIAVAPRIGGGEAVDLPFPRDRVLRIDMPHIGISSTWMRERAEKGLSLRYLTPASVVEYILENRLYGFS
jgi:nicotinate-nucleotide adenylyltransferase